MITFSTDPEIAERQMQAVIFYLTTFGYIDGDFEDQEKDYVRSYIERLVESRVRQGIPDADAKLRDELVTRFTQHFNEVFEGIDTQVRELFTEAVALDEEQDAFIHAKLKLRCFEYFQSFDRANQEALLDAMDALINADGQVHPAEQKFRNELVELFESDLGVAMIDDGRESRVTMVEPRSRMAPKVRHPFFDQFEHHYSADNELIRAQVDADLDLVERVKDIIAQQNATGAGMLGDAKTVDELAARTTTPFLDGHVYYHPAQNGPGYELTVLGDLHGCYSCLKGAIMQSRFFEKVAAYRKSPTTTQKPILVLLGDYIDRGLFSLNGVLRTVMQLFVTAPEHVYVLRGNHEYYLEYKGQIFGGVKPAEAINTLKPHLPVEVFRKYMSFFEVMPNTLLFDRTLFVHAGIPRDRLVKERWTGIATLNDPDVRFQMMWSDPSSADVIPAALQEQSARFPFGKLQAAAFLQRMGCHTLVRGHEKVDSGFERTYDGNPVTLLTLFSAGGDDNGDLPPESSYRSVKPKALTMTWVNGETTFEPWDIDYRTYNDPEYNAFFQVEPEIEHRQ